VLGAQSPGPLGGSRPVTSGAAHARALVFAALAGCATRADLVRQDRELRSQMQEERKQLQAVQRELERLRSDVEEAGGRGTGAARPSDDRISVLEERIARLESGSGGGPPASAGAPPPEQAAPPAASATASARGTPPRGGGGPPEGDGWRREIAREQERTGTEKVPERAEYLTLLDGLARQDCQRTVPQLNTFAANHKDSTLADNALYWAARCYALRGENNQAISKFYDVVTRYPKGDKAPAALWAQGNLFVDMGDSPDARLAFSKLIRDYPSSEEAARARQKLSELEN
jgi:tol-pal system protein YbgF